jgi:hypothetical protein
VVPEATSGELQVTTPRAQCLVWFDINKEADWRISSSPESEAAFIRMAKDPYFNPEEFRSTRSRTSLHQKYRSP